jgi:hypothetical protein
VGHWAWVVLFAVSVGLLMGAAIASPLWYLSSFWSGWSALARDYRATAPWKGPRWRSSTSSLAGGPGFHMGIHSGTGLGQTRPTGASYGGFVAVGADETGLHLSAVVRLWHPTLLIPWDHVQMEVPANNRNMSPHQIYVGRDPVVCLSMPERIANRIAPAMLRSRAV